jgi:hypothetical protein
MAKNFQRIALWEPVDLWVANENINNAASLTSPAFDTLKSWFGSLGGPPAGGALHHNGMRASSRVLIGVAQTGGAAFSIDILGGLNAPGLIVVENIVSAAAIQQIQRDLFWPFCQFRVNNTSGANHVHAISVQLLPGSRGI